MNVCIRPPYFNSPLLHLTQNALKCIRHVRETCGCHFCKAAKGESEGKRGSDRQARRSSTPSPLMAGEEEAGKWSTRRRGRRRG